MRHRPILAFCFAALFAALLLPSPAAAQDGLVVDRVVARIENDIITLSDVQELAAYQRLAGRQPAQPPELLRELIDQWIVANDAAAARFAPPPPQQVDAEFSALQNQVGTPQQFAARLRSLGLTEPGIRRIIAKQILEDSYIEYKFRAVARVEPGAVERYYHDEFVPQLHARHQPVPPLDDVRDSITDLLLERDITRRSQLWIDQTRAQLDIEIFPENPS
ncbi:MAG TPA: hypothetical protein VLW54_03350 [Candidatus Acidoferrales bacterium]|nr:hypothetical protein [Candidatus Acidoferrales bacterium]